MNNDILENIKNSIKDAPIVNVVIENLKIAEYNPRKATAEQKEQVKTSISRFGMAVPILVNSAPEREQVIIGGHLRVQMAKELGILEVPVRYINIPDLNLEKELNIRLNKNTGDFDYEMLANFFQKLLDTHRSNFLKISFVSFDRRFCIFLPDFPQFCSKVLWF